MVDRLLGRGRQQDQAEQPPIKVTWGEVGALANVGAHGSMPAEALGDDLGGLARQGLLIVKLSDRGRDFLRGKYPDHQIVSAEPTTQSGE
jgi:hypothetical protein